MLFKKPETVRFLTTEEKEQIIHAIQSSEKQTSGEIRVFIEKKCRHADPLKRAVEIFYKLGMEKTANRNAVILYIAYKDRQMAVYGDEGIHQKVGSEYWNNIVAEITGYFKAGNIFIGLQKGIEHLGSSLTEHFPYHNEDKNELPDDILFGR